MDIYEIIAQGIGILGMACNVLSFQAKKNFWLFMLQCFGTAFFTVNFFMLGSNAAAYLNILAFVRCLFLLGAEKTRKPYWLALLLILNIAVVCFSYAGIPSLIILIAQLAQTATHWTDNGKIIRITQLFCCSPLWLAHNIIIFSIGGILCEAFVIVSTIVSIVRFGLDGFEKR